MIVRIVTSFVEVKHEERQDIMLREIHRGRSHIVPNCIHWDTWPSWEEYLIGDSDYCLQIPDEISLGFDERQTIFPCFLLPSQILTLLLNGFSPHV
jgi:hypothetical protein